MPRKKPSPTPQTPPQSPTDGARSAAEHEQAEKHPGGRPTSYKPEYADQAAKLCELGATDIELADFFGVATSTVYLWKSRHPQFSEALKAGKAAADQRVERSLYAKATGYTFDSVKIMQNDGEPLIVPYREHVAPDTTAAIFWLKNRKPDEWRDKKDVEHSGNVTLEGLIAASMAPKKDGDPQK